MQTQTKVKAALIAAAGLAGIVLGQTNLARAGTKGAYPIKITTSGLQQIGEGSLTRVRQGGTSADYIGCSFTSDSNWMECYAVKGGTSPGSMYCLSTTAGLGWYTLVTNMNAASAIRFKAKSGACLTMDTWHESDYL